MNFTYMNNVDSFTELVFACHVCLFLFANMFLIVFVYFYSQVLDFFCGKCGAQKHYGVFVFVLGVKVHVGF